MDSIDSTTPAPLSAAAATPHTLTIDIGGTGIKMLPLNGEGRRLRERVRELTPKPSTPEAVLATIGKMLAAQPVYDRVSVGFPGVVVRGVVHAAHNLGTAVWCGYDLQQAITELTGKPTRVINGADLQGYGVIEGKGVELVLTLGTGLGSSLYVNGHLVPNLELGHHPFRRKKTYEELVCDAELDRIGREKWQRRVLKILAQLEPLFHYDRLHLGGGNAQKLRVELPAKARIFENAEGLTGGVRLWQLD